MKSISALLFYLTLMSPKFAEDQLKFNSFWYDGNAEISVYKIKEERYGEYREGHRIMVFVTEPMRLSTFIKPDVKLPESEKIKVMKLNDIRKFNTGIYDYSTMNSVFSSVENSNGYKLGSTMKIAFSSQEWCGNVYENFVRLKDSLSGSLYSYFESEGERKFSIAVNDSIDTEDNLWIRIRELNGPFMKTGQTLTLKLLPARWSVRKSHSKTELITVEIHKGKSKTISTKIGKIKAVPFTWKSEDKTTQVWVESRYPHRILSWEEPDGSSGTIIKSKREPYWKQKSLKFEKLRKSFGL